MDKGTVIVPETDDVKKERLKDVWGWRMGLRRRVVLREYKDESEEVKRQVQEELEREEAKWLDEVDTAGAERTPAQYQA